MTTLSKLFLVALLGCACVCVAAEKKPLLNGRDLSGWKASGKGDWQFGKAKLDPTNASKLIVTGIGTEMVATDKVANLTSEEQFGDCVLEFEFMLSRNSNSGVKLMKIYEIQLFDSFGKDKVTDTDCGAVYLQSPPKVNACAKPGEWQKMIIEFKAPRFDSQGNKTANAKFTRVVLNGKVMQENYDVPHGTNMAKTAKEHPQGALFVQGDHGAVAFRNMTITRLE